MRALLDALGRPERGPRIAHVAGSKGKGSVTRMVAAGLAGRSPVGCYTSPHLVDLAERVVVDGAPVPDDALCAAAERLLPFVRSTQGTPDAPTFFEIMTGVAWLCFRERGCAHVALETGLGGRLDATNACEPAVTVITPIEREHAKVLGDTVEQIAIEKAGIVKPGVPLVTQASGAALRVIRARAEALGAPATVVGEDVVAADVRAGPGPRLELVVEAAGRPPLRLVLPVAGAHLAGNAAAAATALRLLGVPDDEVRRRLSTVLLPGTLQPLGGDPLVVIDGAHTGASARAARDAVRDCWPGRRLAVLLALLDDKDEVAVLEGLVPGAHAIVATELPTPRSRTAADLAAAARRRTDVPVAAIADVARALEEARARAGPGGLVLAAGSIRLAGAILALGGS
jgi:dihydrofolate synthase/folylpolyglutamate synthase